MSNKISEEDILEHLTVTLDNILAVIVGLGRLSDVPVPDEALDAALRSDDAYLVAQEKFRKALRPVLELDEGLGMNVEEKANALAARAAEIGYRLGANSFPR